MAFNQSFPSQKNRRQLQSVASSLSVISAIQNDELSSSNVPNEWILFSPSSDAGAGETNENSGDENDGIYSDILSISGDQQSAQNKGHLGEDDDDSLIDSLEDSFDHNTRLSLPADAPEDFFVNKLGTSHDDEYATSLLKDDYITNRIDSWRKEQAKILIDDLRKTSSSSLSSSHRELLNSWGVDDGDLSAGPQTINPQNLPGNGTQSKNYKHGLTRFYGDDIFEKFTDWEVSKIKEAAKQLSSALIRDPKNRSTHDRHQIQTSGRRSSLLKSLTRSNRFILEVSQQPFWKKDLNSAHSSQTLSTNSIMFGNISFKDVL